MSYRNSERKTQEMHATIALAVAVARAMLLRRRFFCEEDEEDNGSIDILSLFFACGDDDAPFSLSKKSAFFSRVFFEWIFSNSFRGIIISRARERAYIQRQSVSEDNNEKKKKKKSRQSRTQRACGVFVRRHRRGLF